LIIDIKVMPSSGKQKFILDKSGQVKCYLKSAPEGGKANLELVKFMSKQLKIPRDGITILLGATARKKRLKIDLDITFDELISRLGIARQLDIQIR